jgi:Tfp pilus assembly protein PilV
MVLLLVIGLGAVGAGGSLLYLEETRHATAAEADAAGQQELASLWQRMTIGQIFPKTASYGTTGGISPKATLIGIAPQSSCAAAADPAVAQALNRYGCVTMLRATYADQSGTILATVGIAVMKSTSGAEQTLSAIQGQSTGGKTGILAVGFPGTAFPGSAREVFGTEADARGPYLFFYTAGYADGRSTTMQQSNGESITTDIGSGVMNSISLAFTAPAKPCASKDISC